jgi:hypothetical protein
MHNATRNVYKNKRIFNNNCQTIGIVLLKMMPGFPIEFLETFSLEPLSKICWVVSFYLSKTDNNHLL